jgi:hypothetical protein
VFLAIITINNLPNSYGKDADVGAGNERGAWLTEFRQTIAVGRQALRAKRVGWGRPARRRVEFALQPEGEILLQTCCICQERKSPMNPGLRKLTVRRRFDFLKF